MNLPVRTRRGFMKALGLASAGCALTGALVAKAAAPRTKPMRTIISKGLGRIIILSFDRGEKLRESIRAKLAELGVRNAVLLSAIGTLEKARFHRIKNTNRRAEDEIFELDGPMELATVNGIVADGEPHFHMVFQGIILRLSDLTS